MKNTKENLQASKQARYKLSLIICCVLAAALLASGTIVIIASLFKPSNAADTGASLISNPVFVGTAELGVYPQTYVGNTLNETLKTLGDNARTGKFYTSTVANKNEITWYEYAYDGKRYVKVDGVQSGVAGKESALFSDGVTIPQTGGVYFFQVEPLAWDIYQEGDQWYAVSRSILGSVSFNALGSSNSVWRESYLRSFLNNHFVGEAGLNNYAAARTYYASSTASDTAGSVLTDQVWLPSYFEFVKFYTDAHPVAHLWSDYLFAGGDCYLNDKAWFTYLRSVNPNNNTQVAKVDYSAENNAGKPYGSGGKVPCDGFVPAFVLNQAGVAAIYGIPETLPAVTYDGTAHTVALNKPADLAGEFSYQFYRDGEAVDAMVNAGTYRVAVAVDGKVVGNTSLTINPAPLTAVTVAQDGNYSFTGNAIVPDVTVRAGNTTLVKDTDYVITANNNVNAGTANYTVEGIGNYQGTLTGNFTIVPQVVTRPTADGTTYIYNAEPQTYQIATHAAYTISANTTQTNAGQYSIIVSLNNTSNYVWDNQTTGNLTYRFQINRAVVPIPAVQTVDLDANDELIIDTYYRSPLYNVTRIRSTDGSDPTNYLGAVVKDGSYKVVLNLNDTTNYCWQDGTDGVVTVDFAINVTYQPNQLTGEIQIDGWTYGDVADHPDGVTALYGQPTYYYTTDAAVANVENGVNINEWTPWYAAVPHGAGTYYVIAYVPATDAANVAVHSNVVTLTIAPKTLSVSQVVMAVKTFDGTTDGAGQIALSGVVTGDTVNARGVFTWADSAAGTKDFTVTDLLLDNPNYVLDSTEYHGTDSSGILWRVVMRPVADTRNFTYNGREQIYDLPRSEFYTADGAGQTDAGDYTVTVALNDTVNYQWDDGSHDALTFPFSIAKADLTVAVTMADCRVNDEPTAPVVTATLNGTVVADLPWVFSYLSVDTLDAAAGDVMPTELGNYRVTASLTDHPNFNDVTASTYFQIYQLITADDGLGSLVIAADGSYGLILSAQDARTVETTTSVNYAMQITRDGAPIDTVGDIELQILVPPALQKLAQQDDVVAFDLLQKNLAIMVTADGNTQKINQFTLLNQNGQVYAVFAYRGAAQADVTFAYTVPVTGGFNWGIFIGSALAVAAVVIFIVALVLVLKMKRRKESPVLV